MINKILVPVDGSDHSRKALAFACDMADKYHATLRLLHVVQTPAQGYAVALEAAAVTIEALQEEIDSAGRKVVNEAVQVARDHGCANPETDIADGPAAQRILEDARSHGVDLIVMGSRGLSDIAGLLVGSVSHKVTHLAECTCVTVR